MPKTERKVQRCGLVYLRRGRRVEPAGRVRPHRREVAKGHVQEGDVSSATQQRRQLESISPCSSLAPSNCVVQLTCSAASTGGSGCPPPRAATAACPGSRRAPSPGSSRPRGSTRKHRLASSCNHIRRKRRQLRSLLTLLSGTYRQGCLSLPGPFSDAG